jgi:hypothetical protein
MPYKNKEDKLRNNREWNARNKEYYADRYKRKRADIRKKHKEYYARTREERLQKVKEYAGTVEGKEVALRAQERRRKKFPEKYRAHTAVSNALKLKILFKLPCSVCGTTEDVHAHHDDYTKPLDVIWLCRKHHQERHKQSGNDTLSLSPTKGDTHA